MPSRTFLAVALLSLVAAAPAAAQAQSAEDSIRATLSRWYEELAKQEKGRPWSLVALNFIEASPPHRYIDTGARKLGPRVYTSLAAQALKFTWEIDSIRLDSTFARVQVRERGYFYASAVQRTYERAASTTFILERGDKDGRWLIAAHHSGGYGIPPDRVTDPMPDLRALHRSTVGGNRDSATGAFDPEP